MNIAEVPPFQSMLEVIHAYTDGSVECPEQFAAALIEAIRKPSVAMILSCGDVPWSQQDMWERSINALLTDKP